MHFSTFLYGCSLLSPVIIESGTGQINKKIKIDLFKSEIDIVHILTTHSNYLELSYISLNFYIYFIYIIFLLFHILKNKHFFDFVV